VAFVAVFLPLQAVSKRRAHWWPPGGPAARAGGRVILMSRRRTLGLVVLVAVGLATVGGDDFWHVEYDPETKRFSGLAFNGVA
jgi:hypothetical protein